MDDEQQGREAGALPSGRFAGRVEFQQLVRDALARGAN